MSAADAQTEGTPGADADCYRDIDRRIRAQRINRFDQNGPDLAPVGSARFRHDGRRLLVGYAVTHPGMAAVAVQRVVAYATNRDLQVMWLVAPESTGEEELPDALTRAGFRLDERLILMGRCGAIYGHINPEARVERVTTFDGMRAYEYGSRRSFYEDPTPDDRMVASRASDRWRQQEQGWYRYFVVLYHNRIVGGCYVTLWEDVPTLMGVYTAPEARGQGIATSMLSFVTQSLVQSGRDPYCLFVKDDNPARNLYRSLGFVELSRDETYLSPTGSAR